jgi:hypothetical protein
MNEQLNLFKLLYPCIEECSIQLIHDYEKDKKKHIEIKHLSEWTEEELKEKNDEWFAVFFGINPMEKGKRSQSACTKICVWAAEMDKFSKEEQALKIAMCPLLPTLIVESKKSYHMYWFAKDATIDNYKKIGRWLKEHFDGDGAVCTDWSTLLRLPWFYHSKDPNDKFLVRIFENPNFFSWNPYTEQEMMDAYPYQEPELVHKPAVIKDEDDIRDIMSKQNNMYMLDRLSATYLINWEKITYRKNNSWHQIICNEKETWCWIDSQWYIGSWNEGWPTWMQWVLRYGNVDKKDLRKWFLDNCKDLLPAGFSDKPKLVTKSKNEIRTIDKSKYTRGIKYMPPKMPVFDKKDFVILAWYPWSWKTQFTYFLAQQNASFGMKTAYISLEMVPEKMIDMLARKKAGIEKYRADRWLVTDKQISIYQEESKRLQSIPNLLICWFDQAPTEESFEQEIIKLKNEWYGLFFVDNLWYFSWKGNELEVQHKVTQKCRHLVNDLDICIIMLHHMNKPQRKSGISKPGWIGGIRWNQKIIDNSTLIFEIWRDQEWWWDMVELYKLKDTYEWHLCRVSLKFVKWNYEIYEKPSIYDQANYLD